MWQTYLSSVSKYNDYLQQETMDPLSLLVVFERKSEIFSFVIGLYEYYVGHIEL